MFVNVCLRMYSLNVPNAMYMCILIYLLKYMCIVYLYIVFISLHSSLPFGPLCSTLQGTKTSYKSNCRLIEFFLSFSLCGYCFLWRFKTFLCAKVKKVFLSFFSLQFLYLPQFCDILTTVVCGEGKVWNTIHVINSVLLISM